MKPRRKKAKARGRIFRVWTHAQAATALPYIASIMRTVREQYLAARANRLRAKHLQGRPGRPDRQALLALEAAVQEAEEAEGRFEEALKELWRLNIYCLDPVQGLALIPFAHPDQQLAWFVFELFEKDQLRSWRFHGDPLESRRPLSDEVTAPPAPTFVV
jgi:hypothetical protein